MMIQDGLLIKQMLQSSTPTNLLLILSTKN